MQLSAGKKNNSNDKKICIDLNCDLAQSFGIYKNDVEFSLLPYVSSVNISCGSHSADPVTIMNALKKAKENNLAVGAHIGYPDIQGFGYRDMAFDAEELEALVVYQLGALSALAKSYNISIEHVRPHGALYKKAATDLETSVNIAKAIAKFDPWLIFVCASGEILKTTREITNIRTAGEVFADKEYNFDGSINYNKASVIDLNFSNSQLEELINNSSVINNNRGKTKVDFKTIHLNMNSEISLEIAKAAKNLLTETMPLNPSFVAESGWL